MRSKKGSLHRSERSPFWIFRRYSSVKLAEFVKSTGVESTDKNRSKAYSRGIELYDEWLGTHLTTGRQHLIKDIARVVLASKLSTKGGKTGPTYRSAHNQIEKHIIPRFGHLKPHQVDSLLWDEYDAEERAAGRKALFNTRKYMIEILRKAEGSGLIKKVPKLSDNDPPPSPPKYLKKQTVRSILIQLSAPIKKKRKREYLSARAFTQMKYFFYMLYKMGMRPEEALQYEWSMFHWKEGEHGTLHIPALITKTNRQRSIPVNSRVSRVMRHLQRDAVSKWVFPSPYKKGERQRNYRKAWDSAVTRAGIDATTYNLRDTAITDMLKRGLSPIFIARYVDNSASIIETKYAVAETDIMKKVAG